MENRFIKQEDMSHLFESLLRRVLNANETVTLTLHSGYNGTTEVDIQMKSQGWKVHNVVIRPEAAQVAHIVKSRMEGSDDE